MSVMLIALAYCVGRWHGHRIAMRFLRGPTAAGILADGMRSALSRAALRPDGGGTT